MQAACERMDRLREENRRLLGEQDLAVQLNRRTREHGRSRHLGLSPRARLVPVKSVSHARVFAPQPRDLFAR
jgi:hypothetical protein